MLGVFRVRGLCDIESVVNRHIPLSETPFETPNLSRACTSVYRGNVVVVCLFFRNRRSQQFHQQSNTIMHVQYTVNTLDYGFDLPLKPILSILINILLGYYAYTWLTAEDESAVDFQVEIPAQCKKGWLETAEVLESPSIQVLCLPATL